jgi:hypothetical protein
MVGEIGRSGSGYRRAIPPRRRLGGAALLGVLALAACAEPVPPPIYAQQPYPAPVYQPYYGVPYYSVPYAYARPAPYYGYGPCCAAFSFSYRSGGYHGRHWHR